MTGFSWFSAIFSIALWTLIAAYANPLASRFIPRSWWLDVRAAQVRDVTDGGSPEVVIDRDVNADFVAQLRTALYPLSGGEYRVCRRLREQRPYTKGEPFPDYFVTLASLQDVPPNSPCILENGDYRVDFTWEARDVFWWLPGVTLSYTVRSNIFNVSGVQ